MEKITHRGLVVEVVQTEVDIAGKIKTFEYARRSPGTRLIIEKDGRVLLTREFRRELGRYDFRLPGGKVYDTLAEYNAALESGVDMTKAAQEAAVREAHEEVGVMARSIEHIHTSVCGATVVWDLYYFVVHEFEEGEQELEDGEDITSAFYSKEEVREMCLRGDISEERSALVLLRHLA